MLTFWAVLAYPARHFGGSPGFVYSLVAALLCFAPTALTLIWSHRAARQDPNQQLLMVVGGTGVRMAFVLGAGLGLYLLVPYFQQSLPYLGSPACGSFCWCSTCSVWLSKSRWCSANVARFRGRSGKRASRDFAFLKVVSG